MSVASLAAFFAEFGDTRRQTSQAALPRRLSDLFAQLRPLVAGEPESAAPPRSDAASTFIDETRLRQLFERLAGPLEQARRDGSLADIWDIAGLGRNEVRNAAALAALWNPRLCGTVAVDFLAAFFARLQSRDLPDRVALEAGYTIRTEDRPVGEASERVDIVVETRNFLVGVEIKIDAAEGPGQLQRYRTALQARLGLKIMSGDGAPERLTATLIYLSLDPDGRSDLAAVGARWSDVAAAARSVVPKAEARRLVDHLVAQFANHVAAF